ADAGLARADVEDVGIRRRDRDRADRADGLAVENRPPVRAAVGGLPHAPGDRAEVEDLRLAGDAGHGEHAPAAEGTDEAPLQGAGGGNVGGGRRGEEDEESKYAASTVHPRILIDLPTDAGRRVRAGLVLRTRSRKAAASPAPRPRRSGQGASTFHPSAPTGTPRARTRESKRRRSSASQSGFSPRGRA